jgi:CheY-like chemotaxis protein
VPVQAAVPTSATYNFSAYHILLVEDNEVNQHLALELLKDTGVKVTVASNGREAVTAVTDESTRFDLLLMDIQMPVMDGYQATRLIRGDDRFRSLPIIAMTAHALREEQQKIFSCGMDAHITKPIDACTMLQVIGSFLGEQPVCELCPVPHHDYSSSALNSLCTHSELDVVGALDRLDGNEKIYTWLLRSFIENKADSLTAIQEALSQGDTELAVRLVHTLKSSAGTIGAVELAALAHTAETALEQESPLFDCNAILDGCVAEMERLVTTLTHWLPPAEPSGEAAAVSSSLDVAVVTPILEQLLQHIHDSDCKVDGYLDYHHTELASLPIKDLEQLKKQLEKFDFEAARTALLALAAKNGIELEERLS